MTKTLTDWLHMKKLELLKQYERHGPMVNEWDAPKYFEIINAQAREIRRLKTKLGEKEKMG